MSSDSACTVGNAMASAVVNVVVNVVVNMPMNASAKMLTNLPAKTSANKLANSTDWSSTHGRSQPMTQGSPREPSGSTQTHVELSVLSYQAVAIPSPHVSPVPAKLPCPEGLQR